MHFLLEFAFLIFVLKIISLFNLRLFIKTYNILCIGGYFFILSKSKSTNFKKKFNENNILIHYGKLDDTFYESFAEPHLSTIGYWLYCGAVSGELAEYPIYSAMGLALTAIAVPVTLVLRWALNRLGPSEE